MPRVVNAPDLVIPNAGTTSNELDKTLLDDADMLSIWGAAAFTGTITVEVSPTEGSAADFGTLTSGGTDVTVVANKVTPITDLSWKRLRLKSSLAEGAARTCLVNKRGIVI